MCGHVELGCGGDPRQESRPTPCTNASFSSPGCSLYCTDVREYVHELHGTHLADERKAGKKKERNNFFYKMRAHEPAAPPVQTSQLLANFISRGNRASEWPSVLDEVLPKRKRAGFEKGSKAGQAGGASPRGGGAAQQQRGEEQQGLQQEQEQEQEQERPGDAAKRDVADGVTLVEAELPAVKRQHT